MTQSPIKTEKSSISLTDEQVSRLKHQPDTDQGLRDQALMCLLLNEKLAVKSISSLRATVLDTTSKVLILSPEEELPLTEETFRTLQTYVTRTTPAALLLQASVSNGELSGGGMTPGAIYGRVEHLGSVLGLQGKLTVEACYAYHNPLVPVPRKRRRRAFQVPAREWERDIIQQSFVLPATSIDRLMSGLAELEVWLSSIQAVQQGGNLTPRFEHVCQQIDDRCATLAAELASLQRVVKILPLHIMLLRLFPHLDITESLLLKLEVYATGLLTDAFLAGTPRQTAEERACRECSRVISHEIGEEKLPALEDLLRGIVFYASMHAQRRIEARIQE